jgi:hypothetical protein
MQKTFYFLRHNKHLQPISEDEFELALQYQYYYSQQVDDGEEEW